MIPLLQLTPRTVAERVMVGQPCRVASPSVTELVIVCLCAGFAAGIGFMLIVMGILL